MSQKLVSVKYAGFYVQLLLPEDTTMQQLIGAMKQNDFIAKKIPQNKLRCKTDGKYVEMNDTVKRIFQKNQEQYQLQIEQNQNDQEQDDLKSSRISNYSIKSQNLYSNISTQKSLKSQKDEQEYSQLKESIMSKGTQFKKLDVKVLKKIVKYLQDRNFDALRKSELNHKLDKPTVENLKIIGDEFYYATKKSQYLIGCVEVIVQKMKKEQKEIDEQLREISTRYEPLITKEFQGKIKQMVKQATRLINTSKKYPNLMEEKDELNATVSSLQDQCNSLEEQIVALNDKLREQQQKPIQPNNSQELQKLQIQVNLGKTILQNHISKIKILQSQLIQKDKQITNKQKKIKQLLEQIERQKTNSLEEQVKSLIEMQELPENSIILAKANSPLSSSSKNKIINPMNEQMVSIESIITNKKLHESLKSILKKQSGSEIRQLNELLSFHPKVHKQYSLRNSFHYELSNKASLLLIAQNQDGKVFGAFTEQKVTLQPQDYFQSDFNGNSFLFTQTKDTISQFKLKRGEVSLLYDFNKLIFGNMDLVLNFKKNICESRTISKANILKSSHYDGDFTYLLKDKKEQMKDQEKEKYYKETKITQFKIFQVIFDRKE